MLAELNLESVFADAVSKHLTLIQQLDRQRPKLQEVANRMTRTLLEGGKILWCGNGGSAADSQHLASELVGRFRRDRPGMASIALCENAATIIGIANDYGFQEVFSRQVEALCQRGDVFVGISTSGASRNVVMAALCARRLGAYVVAITGEHGGKLGSAADTWIRIPSNETARIQEAYMLCGHMICDWVELAVSLNNAVQAQRQAG
jgi:D-sedoheptulose 7-phosphate isomerase